MQVVNKKTDFTLKQWKDSYIKAQATEKECKKLENSNPSRESKVYIEKKYSIWQNETKYIIRKHIKVTNTDMKNGAPRKISKKLNTVNSKLCFKRCSSQLQAK